MPPRSRLLTEQRRRNLLDLVDQEGQVTVADMIQRFSISAVTVRSDLDALAKIGAVVRSRGGAIRRLEATQDYPLRAKETLHRNEKVRIGKAAAELIRPGETIILDSGTTTAEVARHKEAENSVANGDYECPEHRNRIGRLWRYHADHDWRLAPASFLLVCRATSRGHDE